MSSQSFEGQETKGGIHLGEKHRVSHIHIFGCPFYIHIPHEKCTNLEPSSLKGIFVGYSETSKPYRFYIPSQQKVVVSGDVEFDEDAWSSNSQEPPTVAMEVEELSVPKTYLQK